MGKFFNCVRGKALELICELLEREIPEKNYLNNFTICLLNYHSIFHGPVELESF
jgi:hypothetical protein